MNTLRFNTIRVLPQVGSFSPPFRVNRYKQKFSISLITQELFGLSFGRAICRVSPSRNTESNQSCVSRTTRNLIPRCSAMPAQKLYQTPAHNLSQNWSADFTHERNGAIILDRQFLFIFTLLLIEYKKLNEEMSCMGELTSGK